MDSPRVLHLIPRFGIGGAETTTRLIIQGCRGDECVACYGGNGVHLLEENGISWFNTPLYPSNIWNFIRSFFVLRQIVRARHIQLIHSHHRFCSLVARFVSASTGVGYISTVHDLASGRRWLTRLGNAPITAVFSEAVRAHLVKEFGFSRESILKLPMGTDLKPLTSGSGENNDESRPRTVSPIFIYCGRMVSEKGVDVLLNAIPQVLAIRPDARFVFVGDGPETGSFLSLANELGISDSVEFTGWIDNPSARLSEADVVVVPSRSEGFGRSALEALVLGKPVVATRVGGLPEIVRDGTDGFLVPPEDAVELANAMLKVLEGIACGRSLHPRFRDDLFSVEHMCAAFDRLYEAVVSDPQHTSVSSFE